MVPILDELIADSADAGVRHVLIGMAHRGRLNVLAHVMRKSYAQILAEFKEAQGDQPFREDLGWTGDVKYHAGARARVREEDSAPEVVISMPPNPSHLEFVNPVVVGMARAACTDTSAPGSPVVDKGITLPVLIHGDAAFPGQGIVAETLNLSRLRLYDVGGTVHIIANNQIGFTATARQSYSTSYASGLARGFKIPDLPRQRRRPGSLHRGGAADGGVPRAVQARHADRPGRLPAARPQRRRRAVVHAAGDVPDHQRASDRARDLGQAAGRARGAIDAEQADGVCDRVDDGAGTGARDGEAQRAAAGASIRSRRRAASRARRGQPCPSSGSRR